MISLIFIVLEGICNAIMDTLGHHYKTSIFAKWDSAYWNPSVSWVNKNRLPDWIPDTFTDGWHTIKFFHICSWLLWGGFLVYYGVYAFTGSYFLDVAIIVVGSGIIRNLVFKLFYDNILVRK